MGTWGAKKGQAGHSLLETLIALAILGGSAFIVLTSMGDSLNAMKQTEGSFAHTEWDQLVRYELGHVLQRFQKRITDLHHPAHGQLPCTNGRDYFKEVADNSVESRLVYFGTRPNAAAWVAGLNTIYSQLNAYMGANPGAATTRLQQALARCSNSQTLHTTIDWSGRSSFYFCGYGTGALVEVKATFWDFTADSALTCQSQNGNPARGIQAAYRILSFRRDGDAASKFSLKQTSGRVYVQKNVRGN